MKKILKASLILLAITVVAAGCSKGDAKAKGSKNEQKIVKLGVIGADTDVWDDVQSRLKDEGIKLEYVKFSDYNQPNGALADGSIDLNAFQHQFFLDNYNKEHKTDLVSIGNTVNAPMGIYSEKIKDLKKLKEGSEISIPNDVTNGGRALLLLQTADLIKVDPSKGQAPTVSDITENKKKFKITELDAAQTARALQDVDISVINSGVAVDSGFNPHKDAIFEEPVDEKSKPYVNIIVARKEDENNKVYQKIVDAYQTEDTKKVIEKTSKETSFPAWETFGRK
ncbi:MULTISPECIES: MetQ/NlpA family ABC transporter substrate-binding protein [Vagococcus]|uniref:Lipoprotein n=1 Tax=Vagococcus fluvialis bH819 TaxID=1255619 RepID=A0A1X6WLZ0_9ENTE|nr:MULTISPECIES: MetQ/NlpA family ABC transporter substrate-binding protein [Vagococcus]SLM84676.1 Methionine ABC transporter substrate-binding protein [Vagococcus fluvialis bH819]HCM89860.1 MetQ/NlpA family ABC transporter substrate-binding protein [Vagococcus sp.]